MSLALFISLLLFCSGRGGLPSDVASQAAPLPAGEGASVLQEQLLATLARLLMDEDELQGYPICTGM